MKKKFSDKDFLALYNEGLPDTIIAKKLGFSRTTVKYWRRKFNLCANFKRGQAYDKRKGKKSIIPDEKIIELNLKGLNDTEIGKEVGLSKSAINKRRRRLGLKTLNTSRKRIGKEKEELLKKLWFGPKTQKEISKKLGISMGGIHVLKKRLGLPKRQIRSKLQEMCYRLRKAGLSDEEISKKLNISKYQVGVFIGRALFRRCRETQSCVYKALLPETEVQ